MVIDDSRQKKGLSPLGSMDHSFNFNSELPEANTVQTECYDGLVCSSNAPPSLPCQDRSNSDKVLAPGTCTTVLTTARTYNL